MKNHKQKRVFHKDGLAYVYIIDSFKNTSNVFLNNKPFCTILLKPHSPKEALTAIT